MKHFKCSLGKCYPHKIWVKEWQKYHNLTHNNIKCKEKYTIERIISPISYVYDDFSRHRCFVCKTFRTDALTVKKWNCYHICVDGGLIRYGYHNSIPSFRCSEKCCDSIIFDNRDLWFVEFKMNTTSTLDGQLWKDLQEGIKQLKSFIFDLRCKMAHKRIPLHRYFRLSHQHCTVCMKSYPLMNTKRNTYLENFRIETGIKVEQLVIIP